MREEGGGGGLLLGRFLLLAPFLLLAGLRCLLRGLLVAEGVDFARMLPSCKALVQVHFFRIPVVVGNTIQPVLPVPVECGVPSNGPNEDAISTEVARDLLADGSMSFGRGG